MKARDQVLACRFLDPSSCLLKAIASLRQEKEDLQGHFEHQRRIAKAVGKEKEVRCHSRECILAELQHENERFELFALTMNIFELMPDRSLSKAELFSCLVLRQLRPSVVAAGEGNEGSKRKNVFVFRMETRQKVTR